MQINFNNITRNYSLNNEIAEKLIRFVVDIENAEVNEMSLILAEDDYINQMKKQYFDEDVYTDTITFNINDKDEPIEGEMYLSADRITFNAQELNISVDKECANVIIHSVLHLLGYDDQNDEQRKKMFSLQTDYLAKVGYQNILTKGS